MGEGTVEPQVESGHVPPTVCPSGPYYPVSDVREELLRNTHRTECFGFLSVPRGRRRGGRKVGGGGKTREEKEEGEKKEGQGGEERRRKEKKEEVVPELPCLRSL